MNTAFLLFLPESATQADLKTLPRKQSTQGGEVWLPITQLKSHSRKQTNLIKENRVHFCLGREKKYMNKFLNVPEKCPLFLVALGAGLLKLERHLLSSYKMDCLMRLARWP